jgi:acylphosphatase
MQRLTALVHGHVQGVAFRNYTQREAKRLKVTGWVTNLPDGTVKVVAEGPDEALTQLEKWLHKGSPWARVDQVDAEWSDATGEFGRFAVQ